MGARAPAFPSDEQIIRWTEVETDRQVAHAQSLAEDYCFIYEL